MPVPNKIITVRAMTEEDYDQVRHLWVNIKGFRIRSLDDSREAIVKFIRRNKGISCVAVVEDKIVGSILCGHDGRQGSFYHVCVAEGFRMHGIGGQMAQYCEDALEAEGINKISLIAFKKNPLGNAFWSKLGWLYREDVNCYDYILNDCNTVKPVL